MKNSAKKIVSALCIATVMALSTTAQGANDGKKLKIGVSLMTYEHAFMQDMLAAVKKASADNGITLVDVDGGNDVSKQLSGIEDMLNGQKIDGLLLNPVDTDAIAPAVLDANGYKVPVVTMDVGSSKGAVYAHVASYNLKIGNLIGEHTVKLLTAKHGSPSGNVVIFGFSKITSMRDRVAGFKTVMDKYPKIKVTIKEPVVLTVEDCQRLAEDSFTTYGQNAVDVYYGSNATTLAGLVAAQESSARKDFQLVGVDDDPVFISALKKDSSTLAAFVAQTPTEIGEKAVGMVLSAIQGKPASEKNIATTVTLVTRDNVNDYQSVVAKREALLKPFRSK